MKRYFISWDIHSFYDEYLEALHEAGFERDNPEHILLIDGDIFDRGKKPLELYRFLRDFPEDRLILVRGNHEILLRDLIHRGYPESYDVSNGTVKTVEILSPEITKEMHQRMREYITQGISLPYCSIYQLRAEYFKKRLHTPLMDEILAWILSSRWVDYYETPHHIFVHASLPSLFDQLLPQWREIDTEGWYWARWQCPWKEYIKGILDPEIKMGKTIVVGHWHTADFYNNLDYVGEPKRKLDFQRENPIYRPEEFPGLIGLDACTVCTHKVNVLVLNEDEI
ncbi:MAG: metallophosphoesterase [Bacilli bacterium]|nr:metallophosphoesterase [Bacilli bacterium]